MSSATTRKLKILQLAIRSASEEVAVETFADVEERNKEQLLQDLARLLEVQ